MVLQILQWLQVLLHSGNAVALLVQSLQRPHHAYTLPNHRPGAKIIKGFKITIFERTSVVYFLVTFEFHPLSTAFCFFSAAAWVKILQVSKASSGLMQEPRPKQYCSSLSLWDGLHLRPGTRRVLPTQGNLLRVDPRVII